MKLFSFNSHTQAKAKIEELEPDIKTNDSLRRFEALEESYRQATGKIKKLVNEESQRYSELDGKYTKAKAKIEELESGTKTNDSLRRFGALEESYRQATLKKLERTIENQKRTLTNAEKEKEILRTELDEAKKQIEHLGRKCAPSTKTSSLSGKRYVRELEASLLDNEGIVKRQRIQIEQLKNRLECAISYASMAQGVIKNRGQLIEAQYQSQVDNAHVYRVLGDFLQGMKVPARHEATVQRYWEKPNVSDYENWFEQGLNRKRSSTAATQNALRRAADATSEREEQSQSERKENSDLDISLAKDLHHSESASNKRCTVTSSDAISFRKTTYNPLLYCIKCTKKFEPPPGVDPEANLHWKPSRNDRYMRQLEKHSRTNGCKVWCVLANQNTDNESWTPEKYAFNALGQGFRDKNTKITLTLHNTKSKKSVQGIIKERFRKARNEQLKISDEHRRLFPRKDGEVSSRIPGVPCTTENKRGFLRDCRKVLDKYEPRFLKVPLSESISTSWTQHDFINDLNMAMSDFESTERFLDLLNVDDKSDSALVQKSGNEGDGGAEAIDTGNGEANDRESNARTTAGTEALSYSLILNSVVGGYQLNGEWCCAAGTLCKNKGDLRKMNTPHKCMHCKLKVHSAVLGCSDEYPPESGNFVCKKCSRDMGK